jgi:hypothetical protein
MIEAGATPQIDGIFGEVLVSSARSALQQGVSRSMPHLFAKCPNTQDHSKVLDAVAR